MENARSIVSEKSEIKRDGAQAQKNSGRGKLQKGDAHWMGFLVDYKEYKSGIRIDENIWAKICTDALKSGGDPALKLILGSENKKTRLAVIEWSVLEQLVEDAWKYRDLAD
jgi:hypothetical protein